MTRFTIVLAVLVVLVADIQPNAAKPYSEEEDPAKTVLLMTILNAKNRAYEQVQSIVMLGSTKLNAFTVSVDEVVKRAYSNMEVLKKESGNTDTATCDKMKDEIDDNHLKTIDHFRACVEKVTGNAEWEMQSMSFDASILIKDIHAAETVDEELQRRTDDFERRSSLFGQYIKKLNMCNAQSNLPRLKRQNSETLTRYAQCLKE